MHKFDGKGPYGFGTMMGQGCGPCVGCCPMGRVHGMPGGHFGWCCPESKEEQIETLKGHKKLLKEKLEYLEKKLEELESKK